MSPNQKIWLQRSRQKIRFWRYSQTDPDDLNSYSLIPSQNQKTETDLRILPMSTLQVIQPITIPLKKLSRNCILHPQKKIRGIHESPKILITDQRTQDQIDPLQHLKNYSRDLYSDLLLRNSTEPFFVFYHIPHTKGKNCYFSSSG